MVLDFTNMDVNKKDELKKLITFRETDDFCYIYEMDIEGNLISAKGYKKIKPKPEKDFAEKLVEGLK